MLPVNDQYIICTVVPHVLINMFLLIASRASLNSSLATVCPSAVLHLSETGVAVLIHMGPKWVPHGSQVVGGRKAATLPDGEN